MTSHLRLIKHNIGSVALRLETHHQLQGWPHPDRPEGVPGAAGLGAGQPARGHAPPTGAGRAGLKVQRGDRIQGLPEQVARGQRLRERGVRRVSSAQVHRMTTTTIQPRPQRGDAFMHLHKLHPFSRKATGWEILVVISAGGVKGGVAKV